MATRDAALAARPTLRAWLDEYAVIERDCLDALAREGIDLAAVGRFDAETAAVKRRLRAKGAAFRNGEASIVVGPLSPACAACSTGLGSKTFVLSMRCNRDCYFCFNVNQGDGAACDGFNDAWRAEVNAFAARCDEVTHVGLSGGEPLLFGEESVAFVRHVRSEHPDAHVRIYTAGDFLDEAILSALCDAGLDELRMSVKLDVRDACDSARVEAMLDDALRKLALAQRFVPAVMVEMPAIPGTGDAMRELLARLDDQGVFGINLLEFGYPMSDWEAFRARGFEVRNPPYVVAYDYAYPAGLPIDGSELLCLELLEYALDEGLSLGVHYCSLENKNRGQVFRQNAEVPLDPMLYKLDQEDFFYKTLKVFDGDVAVVRERFEALGASFAIDAGDGSLQCHPDWLEDVADLDVLSALSYNVVERTARGCSLRELKLETTR